MTSRMGQMHATVQGKGGKRHEWESGQVVALQYLGLQPPLLLLSLLKLAAGQIRTIHGW